MPTTATSEIRKPARDTDLLGHWQIEPQTWHARLRAHTLAGLVETSGRFRSISEGLVVDAALAAGALVIGPSSIDMRRLFDEFECTHRWLDRDRVEQGAAMFRRYGPSVFSFAGVKTVLSYTESSIVKPLAYTGAYAGDSAVNRYVGHPLGVQPRWYPETDEAWWRKEMGEKQFHFQHAEDVRR